MNMRAQLDATSARLTLAGGAPYVSVRNYAQGGGLRPARYAWGKRSI